MIKIVIWTKISFPFLHQKLNGGCQENAGAETQGTVQEYIVYTGAVSR